MRACLTMAIVPLVALASLPAALGAQAGPRGKAVYDKWCAGCHGDTGAGDGPAADRMLPRPRDFRRAVYQVRTTASGELPTDADLRAVIAKGMPGTAMPEWSSVLSEREIDDVIAYLKSFSTFFEGGKPQAIALGDAPRLGDDAVASGRQVYQKLECWKCHGQEGRGDGQSAPGLEDDWKHPIRAADLTEGWKFNGGHSVEAIYARLRTGLDGTPMPTFQDAVDQKLVTDEQLWHLARYVHDLSPAAPPVREVIRAAQVASLPSGPADSAWARADAFWIPLVGQVIAKPRWFAPTVDGLWVEAMHDGQRLALRLSWNDPSRSPDPAWDEWLARLSGAVTSADGALATGQRGDRVMVSMAPHPADESRRPYFLGGSAKDPVYAWCWTSTPDRASEGTARGLGTFTPSGALTHAAEYAHGRWRVQLVRPLASADTSRVPALRTGLAIPIAFQVSDGTSGEDDVRSAVSTWYAVYLDVPVPTRVYLTPVVSMVLTAGAGLVLVRRAQRHARGAPPPTPEEG